MGFSSGVGFSAISVLGFGFIFETDLILYSMAIRFLPGCLK